MSFSYESRRSFLIKAASAGLAVSAGGLLLPKPAQAYTYSASTDSTGHSWLYVNGQKDMMVFTDTTAFITTIQYLPTNRVFSLTTPRKLQLGQVFSPMAGTTCTVQSNGVSGTGPHGSGYNTQNADSSGTYFHNFYMSAPAHENINWTPGGHGGGPHPQRVSFGCMAAVFSLGMTTLVGIAEAAGMIAAPELSPFALVALCATHLAWIGEVGAV